MTEIAGIGALNAGLIRAAVQNEEQQVAQQQFAYGRQVPVVYNPYTFTG